MWAANDTFRLRLTFFAILIITLLPFICSTAALAEESLAFAGTPPEAFENEDYAWTIIKGGKPPYTFNLTGSLPSGLVLDTVTYMISGKPLRGSPSDSYTFAIRVTDSSSPRLSIEAPFTVTVNYRSNIAVTSRLSAGETDVYVDNLQVAKLGGGGKTSLIFPSGIKHTVSVDTFVTDPTKPDVRFFPIIDKKLVDGLSSDVTFDYFSEYEIHVKSNQPDIPPLPSSGWYKEGDLLIITAREEIEPKPGTQYRFSYWLLPTGEVYQNPNLSWKVTKPGEVIATYDTYYLLTVKSEHCVVEGSDWYKEGSTARWNIKCPQPILVNGFWGHLGVELRPEKDTGTVLMDAPKEIEIIFKPDYSKIIYQIFMYVTFAVIATLGVLFRKGIKKAIARIRKWNLSRKS